MIYRYAKEFTRECFRQFTKQRDVAPQLFRDSTSTKICTCGRLTTVEVYARTLVARSANGDTMRVPPDLTMPPYAKASGVLAEVPICSLYIYR